jgi:hypothetical protein
VHDGNWIIDRYSSCQDTPRRSAFLGRYVSTVWGILKWGFSLLQWGAECSRRDARSSSSGADRGSVRQVQIAAQKRHVKFEIVCISPTPTTTAHLRQTGSPLACPDAPGAHSATAAHASLSSPAKLAATGARRRRPFAALFSPSSLRGRLPPRSGDGVTMQRHAPPLAALLLVFVAWKLFLLAIAAGASVSGPLYDTSSSLLPEGSEGQADLVTRLTSWDALYFVQSARRGYWYEQEWAFASGFPYVVSVCKGEWCSLRQRSEFR